MLNALQIASFIRYRSVLGKLLDLYEMQAVPGWDLKTVENFMPYITITDGNNGFGNLSERWLKGDQALLFRIGRTLEKEKDTRMAIVEVRSPECCKGLHALHLQLPEPFAIWNTR
jgi:hypothetical protein